MRERDVEAYLVKEVEGLGGMAYKFVSPARRSVPDRICIFPGGHIWFVEVKREGEKARPAQQRELDRLSHLGAKAMCLAGVEEIDKWIGEKVCPVLLAAANTRGR